MGFVDAIKSGFSKYVTFSGRASRSEYWYWALMVLLNGVVGMIIPLILGKSVLAPLSVIVSLVSALLSLAGIIPSVSVAVRRLHDVNRSGWWYWIILAPLVGPIVLLVWFCSKGTAGVNRFGPDPLV